MSLPFLVTLAAIRISLRPWPSSSRKASPWNTPSFQVETTARVCCSVASRIASIAASTTGAPNSANSFDTPPLAEMRRAQHRREVAAKLAGVADVQRQQIEQVVAQPAGLVELDRRDAQALLPDLGRAGIVGAMGGAADVALMRAHDGPEQALVAIEYRHEGREIGQMAAAVIGIVEQDRRRPGATSLNRSSTASVAQGSAPTCTGR